MFEHTGWTLESLLLFVVYNSLNDILREIKPMLGFCCFKKQCLQQEQNSFMNFGRFSSYSLFFEMECKIGSELQEIFDSILTV